MKNIALVGFMGTGKTKVAKILSARLNMKYVSTDDLIEEKEGISIQEIFSKKGESYFRKAEKDVIKDASLMENVVIDAGGGAVIDPENVKNLKQKGMIVCLWAEPRVILERTKKYNHRPLLRVADPIGKIKELLESRKPFYERAGCHINTSEVSAEEVADEIERMSKNVQ
ncbi:MAG: shikimate kinase [Candidatus Omnitrophota bacterium]